MSAAALPLPKSNPIANLLELTKLRISGASTFTAAAGYVAFLRGADSGLITTLLGILLLAMGSSALNEVQEHRFDALMPRTATRPIPRGDLTPLQATVFAVSLAVAGFLPLLRPGQDAVLYRRVFMNINLFALVLTAAVILDPFFAR